MTASLRATATLALQRPLRLASLVHCRKNVKCLEDVHQYNCKQTGRAEQLQKPPGCHDAFSFSSGCSTGQAHRPLRSTVSLENLGQY
jgi:hypothetical protein